MLTYAELQEEEVEEVAAELKVKYRIEADTWGKDGKNGSPKESRISKVLVYQASSATSV